MDANEIEVRQKLSKAVDALQLEVDAALCKGGLDVLDVSGSVYGAVERARTKAKMLRLRSVDSALVLGAIQQTSEEIQELLGATACNASVLESVMQSKVCAQAGGPGGWSAHSTRNEQEFSGDVAFAEEGPYTKTAPPQPDAAEVLRPLRSLAEEVLADGSWSPEDAEMKRCLCLRQARPSELQAAKEFDFDSASSPRAPASPRKAAGHFSVTVAGRDAAGSLRAFVMDPRLSQFAPMTPTALQRAHEGSHCAAGAPPGLNPFCRVEGSVRHEDDAGAELPGLRLGEEGEGERGYGSLPLPGGESSPPRQMLEELEEGLRGHLYL